MNHYSKTKSNRESVQTIVTIRHEIPYALLAWTDGACEPNPGAGGWGYSIQTLTDDVLSESSGGEIETTNNRMELLAAIKAIRDPINGGGRPMIVCTDSQLTLLCAIGRWKRKTNLDLWADLDDACNGRFIVFEWWRGHVGTAGNERADELAAIGRIEALESCDCDISAITMLREIATS